MHHCHFANIVLKAERISLLHKTTSLSSLSVWIFEHRRCLKATSVCDLTDKTALNTKHKSCSSIFIGLSSHFCKKESTQRTQKISGNESHLSHRYYPRSQSRYSRRWSGSIPPYMPRCSCRGCCRTVSPSPYYMKTWCRSCSVTELSAGCPCSVHRWTGPGHSPHSRNWAWRSRAQWEAPNPPGCPVDHPDKGLPPDPRSHFLHWP